MSSKKDRKIMIIGGGLAGVEAAWQLLQRGAAVDLYEMRPEQMTPAHSGGDLAELLCSNSLRSLRLENASGLLKKEMEYYHSLVMEAAYQSRVPAGFALAVDRLAFSSYIEKKLKAEAKFNLIRAEVKSIEESIFDSYDALIIASGPLSSDSLESSIQALLGADNLYFFDAQAPIIAADSIDYSKVFRASRYQDGSGDYLNCAFTEAEYKRFYEALIEAKTTPLRSFESLKLFAGCMPLEEIARSGYESLRFGPLKPVGLKRPDGTEAYAVLQLRQDNLSASHYNLTGCQTRLLYGEQERVFRLIPGLEEASFVRHGQMHRNSYINAPRNLDFAYRLRSAYPRELLFVGQLSGVEGYLESAASGLLGAVKLAERLGLEGMTWPALKAEGAERETMLGALSFYLTAADPDNFQPAKSAFGLCRELAGKERNKYRAKYGIKQKGRRGRRLVYAARALEHYYPEAEVEKIMEAEL